MPTISAAPPRPQFTHLVALAHAWKLLAPAADRGSDPR